MTQIPVLSPLGVALIGLEVGSQIRFCASALLRPQDRRCEGCSLGVSGRSPGSAETPIGSHADRGSTDRPFGRSDHRISNAGASKRSLTVLGVSNGARGGA